ncbi:MAG TPA: hypothetical protein VFH54_14775 [Mycobacteriales bacterium]|nr:hypothetical protein [Mycobacteriales bacterium]
MRRLPAALAGAATAGIAERGLRRWSPPHPRWRRRNFRDREVTLAGGPALAAGAAIGALASGIAGGVPGPALAAFAGAVLGAYDDLYGDEHARGLAGHVGALRQRRVTTGLVKLAGLTATGAAVSAVDGRRGRQLILDTALIAGTANLVNLLDLRPGRALKVLACAAGVASVARGPAGSASAGLAGAAVAVLPSDLAERVMIGDCGANAAGATLGACLAVGANTVVKWAALGLVVALTLGSERVSFTDVIAGTPWLRRLDEWGRRP